jgi:predicted O-methyltransferase YrrM
MVIYQRQFDSKWFTESLLPNLSQKSLIIMDNASYHAALPDSAPRLNATQYQKLAEGI